MNKKLKLEMLKDLLNEVQSGTCQKRHRTTLSHLVEQALRQQARIVSAEVCRHGGVPSTQTIKWVVLLLGPSQFRGM